MAKKADTPAVKQKLGRDDFVFEVVITILMTLGMLIVLYPLIYVLSASFSNPYAVITGRVWLWPVEPTLIGYQAVFKSKLVLTGYRNSLIVALGGAAFAVSMQMIYAYCLSIRDFVGRGFFTVMLMITMFFGGGLIPTFLWVTRLGLYDNFLALILPGAVSAYNVIIARTFISSSIPYDLYESATIDGCSDARYFISMILPLAKPVIAVLTLYAVVGQWNNFFGALIYLRTPAKHTLQLVLRNIVLQNQIDYTTMTDVDLIQKMQGLSQLLKYSLIVVSSVPMLIIYPFIQKHFVKGVMIGSVKG